MTPSERKTIRKAIENYETKINGLFKLSGKEVKCSNIRKSHNIYIANLTMTDINDGVVEKFYDCEYPLSITSNKTIKNTIQ